MANIRDAGVEIANPLKKAIIEQQKPYTIQDLSNQVNNDLLKYDSMGVKPNAEVLAKGGLTTTDYNNMVSSLKPTTQTTTPTPTPLAQAVVQQTPQYTPVQYTPVRDNSGLINDSYSNLISALKAQIQQAQNNKNLDINGLPAKYQKDKNTSEVQKANELRTALEMSANSGDKGGLGRQQALETVANGDNRLNAINLQQTAEETSLRNDIANLVLEGNIQQAQLQSERLKDLIANNQYVDQQNYSRLRDSIGDNQWQQSFDQTNSNNVFNQNMETNKFDYSKLRDAVVDNRYDIEYADSRGDVQYNRDYQTDRDKVTDSRYNQEYKDSRADKNIQNQLTQQQILEAKYTNEIAKAKTKYASQLAQSQVNEQKFNEQYAQARAIGYSQEQAASIALKQAQVAKTNSDAANNRAKTNYDVNKPYYNPKTGTNDNAKYNYKTDASFQTTYAAAIKDQAGSLAKLKSDPGKFINAFGLDGFKALYTAASPKSQAIDFSFLEGLQ